MPHAPIGSIVSIYYDANVDLEQGDCIRTPTGRTYLVVSCRRQSKGIRIGRWHIKALVQNHPPEGARTYRLHWYRRNKRRP